jgi:GNAT superfamily N-acetyltransferase
MSDMLVKLYDLPPLQPALEAIAPLHIHIRPACIGEEYQIMPWIAQHFYAGWENGVVYTIHRNPCSLFIAIEKQLPDPERADLYELPPEKLVGFACYDASTRGMFGPMGVHPHYENRGIGTALLLTALHAMWNENYAYVVIGWAGPVEWYAKRVGATLIPDSEPGPFRGRLEGYQ